MTSARIGVFGGTFDPPHVGHMVAAVNVADALALSTVLFVVANVPWQKSGTRDLSPAADRLAMVELAVAGRSNLQSSELEIRRGGDSVTADTLEDLERRCPGTDWVVILGSDAAAGLDTWRRCDDLKRLASLAVVDRPGAAGGRPPDGFTYEVVPCPLMDVSSTDIRARIQQGLPVDYLVPDAVRDYVLAHGLYT